MGFYDIKKSSAWNYSDPDKAGYSDTLTGHVVAMDNPQQVDFNTGKKKYWEDGSPRRNMRLFILTAEGEKTISFVPAKRAALYAALCDACEKSGIDSISDIIGHSITISTEEGAYNQKHPRPWTVAVGAERNPEVKLHKNPVVDYDERPSDDIEIPFD